MAEYIDREAAVRIAESYGLTNGTSIGHHSGVADIIGSAIENLPAADVAPVKHGKWIYESHKRLGEEPRKYNAWYVSIICADCQYEDDARWIVLYEACYPGLTDDKAKELVLAEAKAYNSFRFCPHCGAKMDLED